ncbi:hypothetical protein ABW636_05105 [Aquimarina sp. 2201CG1-2-11]|uniref:hypothetical protein n=1 Tax=Aquimarina discodermiae TaxID=3231043 RepID=UPI003462F1F0
MKKIHLLLFMSCSTILFSQNLINTTNWEAGAAPAPGFANNGIAQENVLEVGLGPYGDNVVLWKAAPDGNGNKDGGYESSYYPIDHTKTYRLTVWIKKTNSVDGGTYFGLYSKNNNAQHSTLNLTNSSVPNAYFWNGDLPQLDKWFLLVGYMHHSGYTSSTNLGGIYDGNTGAKLVPFNDFKFAEGATTLLNRAYLFYDPNVNDNQYFFAPRIEQVNGSEPSIEQLISTNTNSNDNPGTIGTWIKDGENIYYNKSGNVGIGTATPQQLLTLQTNSDTENTVFQINSGGTPTSPSRSQISLREIAYGNHKYGFDLGYNGGTNTFYINRVEDDVETVGLSMIRNSGNVGIGTSTPTQKFEIHNPTSFNTNMEAQNQDHIALSSNNPGNGGFFGGITWKSGERRRASIVATREHSDADYVGLAFFTKGTDGPGPIYESMRITRNGRVGIGTSNPDAELAVNGKIHAKEVKVDLTGWPDYVFEENYQLPTLQEVASHILQKGHLINIPSAKEVEENGVELGQMNAKLLEKIEELTLYTIAQEKKLSVQERQLTEQQRKNEALEARLEKLESLLKK